jgi:hypothetical protein
MFTPPAAQEKGYPYDRRAFINDTRATLGRTCTHPARELEQVMLRYFVPLLALLGCAKPPAAFPNIVRASVGITRPGMGVICGGTAIDERLIMTANHCVDDVTRAGYVDLSNFSKYARRFQWATVIVRDPAADIAILQTDLPLEEWASLRPPVDYEELRVVINFEVRRPEISYVSDLKMGIFKGNSGSGVFGKDGAVVGVVVQCRIDDNYRCDGIRGSYSPIRAEWLVP